MKGSADRTSQTVGLQEANGRIAHTSSGRLDEDLRTSCRVKVSQTPDRPERASVVSTAQQNSDEKSIARKLFRQTIAATHDFWTQFDPNYANLIVRGVFRLQSTSLHAALSYWPDGSGKLRLHSVLGCLDPKGLNRHGGFRGAGIHVQNFLDLTERLQRVNSLAEPASVSLNREGVIEAKNIARQPLSGVGLEANVRALFDDFKSLLNLDLLWDALTMSNVTVFARPHDLF